MKHKLALLTSGLMVTALPVAFSVSCGSSNEGKRIPIAYPEKLEHSFEISNEASLASGTIDKLKKLMAMGINYGPESLILKQIKLVDNNALPGLEEAGLYSKAQTIAVNTKILKSLNLKNEEDQALYLFELIYHEYMHFIADNYFNNTTEVSAIDCEDPGNNQTKEHWSSKFIDEFKKAFHYDVHSEKVEAKVIENKYVSMASKYDAKDIFDIANDKSQSYSLLSGNEVMAFNPSTSLVEFWKTLKSPVIKSDALKYIYSMQELWARKGQLATGPIFSTLNTHSNNGEGFNLEGWINLGDGKQFWSPVLQDILNFSDSLNGKNYLADAIDNEDYESLFLSQFKTHKQISLVTYQNHHSLDSNGALIGDEDHSRIALGGYLPNEKFSYIGFKDSASVFHGVEIKKENGYYLSSFLKASEYLNKDLLFSTDLDGKETQEINSIYDSFDNQVSSNRDFDDSTEDYQVKLNSSGHANLMAI